MAKIIKQGLVGLILVSMVLSLWVGYQRMSVEENYNHLSLVVNEADVRSFSGATGKSKSQVLTEMKKNGIGQVLFKETSLGMLIQAGDITVFKGQSLKTHPNFSAMDKTIPLRDTDTYLVLENASWLKNLKAYGLPKLKNAKLYTSGKTNVLAIPTMLAADSKEAPDTKTYYEEIGIGFNESFAKGVSDMGLGIVAQVRTWRGLDEKSMPLIKKELDSLKGVSLVLFNDPVLPGYPDNIRLLSTYFKDDKKEIRYPMGTIEFSDQIGTKKLAQNIDKAVVRLHTISNGEMRNFTGDTPKDEVLGRKAALDRYKLAASEREMRALLVRFWQMDSPSLSYEKNLTYLSDLKSALEGEGFILKGQSFDLLKMPHTPRVLTLIIALGVAAGLSLLLGMLRFNKLALLGGTLLYLGFLAGYFLVDDILALKAMAFFSVIIFPILSIIIFYPTRKMTLARSIVTLISMSLASLVGGLLMVGLLSDTLFLLKLDHFSGVKLAHLIPILAVPFCLFIWNQKNPLEEVKNLLNLAISYRWAILGGLAVIAIGIYLARTGNDGMKISETETAFRQLLTDYLGVRPRNKEFLIGYPLALALFYYGANNRALWVLTLPLAIGQVSLVNTYAHLHTPLFVSLLRSFNGMFLGILLGALLIFVINLSIKFVKKQKG